MPAISATAPGKIILFGEHAVVYSQPAIAVPLSQIRSCAVFSADPLSPQGRIWITAPDINMDCCFSELQPGHPFRLLVEEFQKLFRISTFPSFRVKVSSDIPVASGLGSGASISVALIRGLSAFTGISISDQQVSDIAFKAEKIYHGNPSGIDNTVIAFEKPVYFIKRSEILPLNIHSKFTLVIGDSGIKSETLKMVSGVRDRFNLEPEKYSEYFSEIGCISKSAYEIISNGNSINLGQLMNENHVLLQKIGVSCDKVDEMVNAALAAGAKGAKICGAGGGGNMIALVEEDLAVTVSNRLLGSGAIRIIITTLLPKG